MKKSNIISGLILCTSLVHATPEEQGLRASGGNFVTKPINLLTPSRFDIIAKYIYANHREKKVKCSWARYLYTQHLQALNGLCEQYSNKTSALKSGISDFIDSFHATLDSIKYKGFDSTNSVIPVDSNGNPRDGAHRSAACILYKRQPTCKTYNYHPPISYLFADHLKKRGLAQKHLDAMALQYCELKNNTYVVTVMPVAQGKDQEIVNLLNHFGTIIYRKNIHLNKNGSINFIYHTYAGEPWVGNWSNNFAGAQHKARCCFGQDYRVNNQLRIFLIQCNTLEAMKTCKQKIRDLFNLDNHSIHISDTHDEAISLARALFVENSIHFLNHSTPKNFPKFQRYLKEYKTWIKNHNINVEALCIDSGAVLAAYGIRDCGDLDYLHHGYDQLAPPSENIESHNHCMANHSKSKDEIIFDPDNHFWYEGVKFASLKVIKDLKKNGGGHQNKQDLAAINSILNQP